MAPPSRTPVTVGTSSCLPGLAAKLLSKAVFPFWEEGRVRGERATEEVPSTRTAQASRGGRDTQTVPQRGGGCFCPKQYFQSHTLSPLTDHRTWTPEQRELCVPVGRTTVLASFRSPSRRIRLGQLSIKSRRTFPQETSQLCCASHQASRRGADCHVISQLKNLLSAQEGNEDK